MFSLGEAYDVFMGRWSARLAPRLVQFSGVVDGDDVLDVGCGTGSLAASVAAAAPSSHIVGIDRSDPYVTVARARHQSPRLSFQVGDAQQLPFEDESFDRTLSLLILNFIPDPRAGLAEMMRVTRPGGTIAAAVWDYGDGMEMLRIFWDEACALDSRADVKDERHMPLSRSGELAALWRAHHLQLVADATLTIETEFTGFDDYWLPFLQQQGPAGAHVATLLPNDRAQLESRLRRRLLSDRADGPLTLRARAWAVRGVVPPRGKR
jgi:SAM-dependent methyltransferase